ncbi:MAG TPA: hypothetical protein VLG37_02080 [Candidatus Saccharimonadales bacterium]|nr:hypothetical protein [Candidatus Saccharimonadales bacterium]
MNKRAELLLAAALTPVVGASAVYLYNSYQTRRAIDAENARYERVNEAMGRIVSPVIESMAQKIVARQTKEHRDVCTIIDTSTTGKPIVIELESVPTWPQKGPDGLYKTVDGTSYLVTAEFDPREGGSYPNKATGVYVSTETGQFAAGMSLNNGSALSIRVEQGTFPNVLKTSSGPIYEKSSQQAWPSDLSPENLELAKSLTAQAGTLLDQALARPLIDDGDCYGAQRLP